MDVIFKNTVELFGKNWFFLLALLGLTSAIILDLSAPDLLQKERLAEKFDMMVGERGVKLSRSEKQRIAVARAFLEDAPIVVLDEATSALDSLIEQQIQTAVFELIKHKTALVIAHRLSTVLNMDRIVVLEKGKYYAMWQHQSGDFLIE